MTLSFHRIITRISVRTRIIVLAAIPVIGFLVNGIAFTARRAARSTTPSAQPIARPIWPKSAANFAAR